MCLKMINATLKRSLAGIVIGLLMVSIVAMGCGESGGEKLTIGGDVPEIAQDASLIDLEAIRGDSELLKEAGEVFGSVEPEPGKYGDWQFRLAKCRDIRRKRPSGHTG